MCKTKYCHICDEHRTLDLFSEARPEVCSVCRAWWNYKSKYPGKKTRKEWEPNYFKKHNRLVEIAELAKQGLKRCPEGSGCGEILPYSEFNKSSETKDGYQLKCRVCHSAQRRQCDNKRRKRRREEAGGCDPHGKLQFKTGCEREAIQRRVKMRDRPHGLKHCVGSLKM